MSRGWALGTKPFKKALVEAHTRQRPRLRPGQKEAREARMLQWESRLEHCLKLMGRTPLEAAAEPKSAAWKVAAGLRAHETQSDVLHGVSRYVGETLAGNRPEAEKLHLRLKAGINE